VGRTCDEDAEGEGGDDDATGGVVQRALNEKLCGQRDAVARKRWSAGFESAGAAVAQETGDEVEAEEHCEEEEGLDSVARDLTQQLNHHGEGEVGEGMDLIDVI